MTLSDHALALLKELEGVRTDMYHDSAGLPTLGCGHLLTRDELSSGKILIAGCGRIPWHAGLTEAQIDALLRQDLAPVELAVQTALRHGRSDGQPATQGQFDCLVLFAFNVGCTAFTGSTLYKKLQAGDYAAVPVQLARWCHCGGQVIAGLQRRRAREIALWEGETV